jgi:hypothetical protein
LIKEAAAAFNAMSAESKRRFKLELHATAPDCAYRDYDQQVYYHDLFLHHGGNLAATPGTSNHGLGLAVDFPTMHMRDIVDQIGANYGFSKSWSDAPSEWWHIVYKPGVWNPRRYPGPSGPDAVPASDQRERDVVAVAQQLLRARGNPGVPVDGLLDARTKHALEHFQRRHGLHPTGRPDAGTLAALRGRGAPGRPSGRSGGRPVPAPGRPGRGGVPEGRPPGGWEEAWVRDAAVSRGSTPPGWTPAWVPGTGPPPKAAGPSRAASGSGGFAEAARQHPHAPPALDRVGVAVAPERSSAHAAPGRSAAHRLVARRRGRPAALDHHVMHRSPMRHRADVHDERRMERRRRLRRERRLERERRAAHEPVIPDSAFPLNRVLALLSPFIATCAGTFAAWLATHFPGLDLHVNQTAHTVTKVVTFSIVALLTGLQHHKYLEGNQRWEQGVLDIQKARIAASPAGGHGGGHAPPDYDAWDAEPAAEYDTWDETETPADGGDEWTAYGQADYAAAGYPEAG